MGWDGSSADGGGSVVVGAGVPKLLPLIPDFDPLAFELTPRLLSPPARPIVITLVLGFCPFEQLREHSAGN